METQKWMGNFCVGAPVVKKNGTKGTVIDIINSNVAVVQYENGKVENVGWDKYTHGKPGIDATDKDMWRIGNYMFFNKESEEVMKAEEDEVNKAYMKAKKRYNEMRKRMWYYNNIMVNRSDAPVNDAQGTKEEKTSKHTPED